MKKKLLSLDKFKIARLTKMSTIVGGTGGPTTLNTEDTQESTDTNCPTDDPDPTQTTQGTTVPPPVTPRCIQTSAIILTYNTGTQ